MLRLARYGSKPSYQVLGLRGYLQYVQGDKQLKDEAKVEKIRDVLPLLKRPEEQRLAIGVIGGIQTAGALELLAAFAADPASRRRCLLRRAQARRRQSLAHPQRPAPKSAANGGG